LLVFFPQDMKMMLLVLLSVFQIHARAGCRVNAPPAAKNTLNSLDYEGALREAWWESVDYALARRGVPISLSTIFRGSINDQSDNTLYDAINCLNDAVAMMEDRLVVLEDELEELKDEVADYINMDLQQTRDVFVRDMEIIAQKVSETSNCGNSWCKDTTSFRDDILNEAGSLFQRVAHYIELLTWSLENIFECNPQDHTFKEYEHYCECEEGDDFLMDSAYESCASGDVILGFFNIVDDCSRTERYWETKVTECQTKYDTVYIPLYLKPLKHAVAVVMTLWMEIVVVGTIHPNIDFALALDKSDAMEQLRIIGDNVRKFQTTTRDHSYWRNYGGTNFDYGDNDGWFVVPGDENLCDADFGYSKVWQLQVGDCDERSGRPSYCGNYGYVYQPYATCVQSTAPVLHIIEAQLDDMLNDFEEMYASTLFENQGNGRCTRVPKLTHSGIDTLEKCQKLCVSDTTCKGIEWNSSNRKCKSLSVDPDTRCNFRSHRHFTTYRTIDPEKHHPSMFASDEQGTWDPWADGPFVLMQNQGSCEDNNMHQIRSAWECMMAAEALDFPTGSGMDSTWTRDSVHGGCIFENDVQDIDFNMNILNDKNHSDRRAICKRTAGTARRSLANVKKAPKPEKRLLELNDNKLEREESSTMMF